MTHNYATLFDFRYAPKGLALYHSLERHCGDFKLWVLPMDLDCERLLKRLDLPRLKLVNPDSLSPRAEIAEMKRTRAYRYMCFTMAPLLSNNLLKWAVADSIMLIDSDCFFFGSDAAMWGRLEESVASFGATPHNFPPSYLHYLDRGVFIQCATWFKANDAGRQLAEQWAASCLQECSERTVGDQGPFNELTVQGSHFVSCDDPGWISGPWRLVEDGAVITEGPRADGVPVTMMHYHETQKVDPSKAKYRNRIGNYNLTDYPITEAAIEYIYRPYLMALEEAEKEIAG